MTGVAASFPGGTSVTLLDVYDDAAPDGLAGGSPHVHLASTECYVVVGGTGELHTIDAAGFRVTALEAGSVVWFTPGTVHRAVNTGGLRVLVVMSNSGLPEAGDAVMTFPAMHLTDRPAYDAAAVLPRRESAAARQADASRRRDLAVEGFLDLRAAIEAGDDRPLTHFYEAAGALVGDLTEAWTRIVHDRSLLQAERSLEVIAALSAGSTDHLRDAAVQAATASPGDRVFGMCGRLRTYDVTDPR